jgi:hypothetical protein
MFVSPLDRFFGGTGGTTQDLLRAGGTAEGYWWDRRAQGDADRTKRMVVPPVPPISTTIIGMMRLQYHRYHRSHAVAGLSCQSKWR